MPRIGSRGSARIYQGYVAVLFRSPSTGFGYIATHKHPKVKNWLKRRPRFHTHFIPTSSSWLNVIERFFRDLDVKRLKRGVFRNVPEVVAAIDGYIDEHNDNPKPIIWSATADKILAKVGRA